MNCPVCGAAVSAALRYSKLSVCSHCKTSLFLEDGAVKHAGVTSVLVEVPSLLQLGRRFRYHKMIFEPLGRVRFDYGDGFWDEWWVVTQRGEGKWISIDEGDIAIEVTLEEPAAKLPDVTSLKVGENVSVAGMQLKVTERHEATCLGMEGELPEVNFPGDVHDYAHLSGPRGVLITAEHFQGETELYKGQWVDPFEVRAL